MREIIEALNKISGENVNIYTDHMLFGKQHIKMDKFAPETEIGIGFRCNEQVIYIDKEDIINWCVKDKEIVFNGKMMEIKIILK